jgi:hypothetical protein
MDSRSSMVRKESYKGKSKLLTLKITLKLPKILEDELNSFFYEL